jgi:hypothetical protein
MPKLFKPATLLSIVAQINKENLGRIVLSLRLADSCSHSQIYQVNLVIPPQISPWVVISFAEKCIPKIFCIKSTCEIEEEDLKL